MPILLKYGADIEKRPTSGATPLLVSCAARDTKLVRILCESEAAVNAADDQGDTPLHNAVLGNSIDIIEVLLMYGAQLQYNNNGYTPLDVAKKKQFFDTELQLQRHFKQTNKVPKKENTLAVDAVDGAWGSIEDSDENLGGSKIISNSLIGQLAHLAMTSKEKAIVEESHKDKALTIGVSSGISADEKGL